MMAGMHLPSSPSLLQRYVQQALPTLGFSLPELCVVTALIAIAAAAIKAGIALAKFAIAALGLSAPLFGERLFPVGTLYDPFIARGLDALNYACYQDARFLLVATPSGLTLAPEGGAHQSIGSPLIGMSQPGLDSYEPAFADETAVLMAHAFDPKWQTWLWLAFFAPPVSTPRHRREACVTSRARRCVTRVSHKPGKMAAP